MSFSLGELIGILGGWGVVVGGIATWLGRLSAKRLVLKWKGDQKKEIESLKEDLSRDRLLLQTALSNFSSGRAASQERRLDALQRTWEAVVDLKDRWGQAIFFYRILQPDEYNQVHDDPKVREMVNDLDDSTTSNALNATSDIEKLRPLIGEKIYILFFIYRAFIGRLADFVVQGKKGKEVPDWRSDDATQHLLATVLTEEEISEALNSQVKALDNVINRLEEKIIQEINLTLSGKRSSTESIKHARKLKKSLDDITSLGQQYT